MANGTAFVERISALDPAQRDALHLTMFGSDLDFVGLMRMRLGEHAVHTWDIAVALDDAATVAPDAVTLLVDTLGQVVTRTGKPTDAPLLVGIHTTAPERHFLLDINEAVGLTEADNDADLPELVLPAEAFLRLVYGRLDPAHSPPTEASADALDLLRGVFPGF